MLLDVRYPRRALLPDVRDVERSRCPNVAPHNVAHRLLVCDRNQSGFLEAELLLTVLLTSLLAMSLTDSSSMTRLLTWVCCRLPLSCLAPLLTASALTPRQ